MSVHGEQKCDFWKFSPSLLISDEFLAVLIEIDQTLSPPKLTRKPKSAGARKVRRLRRGADVRRTGIKVEIKMQIRKRKYNV